MAADWLKRDGGRADENQAKADITRQRPPCSPTPLCRTVKSEKTDWLSVMFIRLTASFRRF
jgi:hypothetical protein